MEGNQAGITVQGLTPAELAKDFLTAVEAGKMDMQFAVQVLIERTYVAAVEEVKNNWMELKISAELRAKVEQARQQRDAERRTRGGVVQ